MGIVVGKDGKRRDAAYTWPVATSVAQAAIRLESSPLTQVAMCVLGQVAARVNCGRIMMATSLLLASATLSRTHLAPGISPYVSRAGEGQSCVPW